MSGVGPVTIVPASLPLNTAYAGSSAVIHPFFPVNTGSVPVTLTGFTFTASGSGNEVSDITQAQLWMDADGDASWETTDTWLGSASYPADNGSVVFPTSITYAPSGLAFFLVYSFQTSAAGNFQANLTSLTGTTPCGALTVTGLPKTGYLITVLPPVSTFTPTRTSSPTANPTHTDTPIPTFTNTGGTPPPPTFTHTWTPTSVPPVTLTSTRTPTPFSAVPVSVQVCGVGDDYMSIWINGVMVGSPNSFRFVHVNCPTEGPSWGLCPTPICVTSTDPALLTALSGNSLVLAARVQNVSGGEAMGTWKVDITYSNGMHSYLTSDGSDTSALQLTESGAAPSCSSLAPTGWESPSFVPTGWSSATIVNGIFFASKFVFDPQTGLPIPYLSDRTDASHMAQCENLYFRQTTTLQMVPPPTPGPSTTATETPTLTFTSVPTSTWTLIASPGTPTRTSTPTATRTVTPTPTRTPCNTEVWHLHVWTAVVTPDPGAYTPGGSSAAFAFHAGETSGVEMNSCYNHRLDRVVFNIAGNVSQIQSLQLRRCGSSPWPCNADASSAVQTILNPASANVTFGGPTVTNGYYEVWISFRPNANGNFQLFLTDLSATQTTLNGPSSIYPQVGFPAPGRLLQSPTTLTPTPTVTRTRTPTPTPTAT